MFSDICAPLSRQLPRSPLPTRPPSRRSHNEAVPFVLIDGLEEVGQRELKPDTVAALLLWKAESESGLAAACEWGWLIVRVLDDGVTEDRAESLENL